MMTIKHVLLNKIIPKKFLSTIIKNIIYNKCDCCKINNCKCVCDEQILNEILIRSLAISKFSNIDNGNLSSFDKCNDCKINDCKYVCNKQVLNNKKNKKNNYNHLLQNNYNHLSQSKKQVLKDEPNRLLD